MPNMRRAPILKGRLQSEVDVRDKSSSSLPKTAGQNGQDQIFNFRRRVTFSPFFAELKPPINLP